MRHLQYRRPQYGSFYILYIGLAAMLIVVWNIFADLGMTGIVSYRHKCALEAASLAAARDLSTIVIEDPRWGYVGLTDHPPVGDETVAEDGYPLPVTGINTIMATVRLELIVAHAVGTGEALDCAMSDLASARAAARRLSSVLRASLSPASKEKARNIHGKEVQPLTSARKVYRENARQMLCCLGWDLASLAGELGYIDDQGSTNTPVPQPANLAALDRCLEDRKFYPAFTEVSAYDESFRFAGLGKQVSLVETALFRPFDATASCSVLKLKATIRETGKKRGEGKRLAACACAQPAYNEDRVPAGYMVVRFPDGVPATARTLRSLLSADQLRNKIALFSSQGGDYPVDPRARLVADPDLPEASVRQAFTRAFFDWLRTAHARPRLDSLYAALDYQFDGTGGSGRSPSGAYLFTVDDRGDVRISAPQTYPFSTQTAYENQLYTVAFSALNSFDQNWTIRIRDQVHRLGRQEGGKHAGQPMPSLDPVDPDQDQSKRLLAVAGDRYDRSRLALELEISNPTNINQESGMR